MYGLSQQDLDIQARARTFADELIPYEVEAELNNGDLPKDVVAAHKARAIELGLFATNMPVSLGGRGYSSLQQVLVQEQVGRVTNALAWVAATPPSWLPAVATPVPAGEVRTADSARRARGVLRHHRGGRRVRRRRHRRDRPPGRRRVPAQRREVARHLLQLRRLRLLPGQARRRRARRRARHVPGRPPEPRRHRRPHAGLHAHDQPSSPDRGVHRRARSGNCTWSGRKATG